MFFSTSPPPPPQPPEYPKAMTIMIIMKHRNSILFTKQGKYMLQIQFTNIHKLKKEYLVHSLFDLLIAGA